MAQQQAAAAALAPPVVVVVNGLADLLPDSYSGDDTSVDIEEFLARFRQWLRIHQNKFGNNAEQVAAIKYVLLGTKTKTKTKTMKPLFYLDNIFNNFLIFNMVQTKKKKKKKKKKKPQKTKKNQQQHRMTQ